jgi:uncharacterized Zn-binding protein involved in type VI secretion
MSGIFRQGDKTVGHGCYPPTVSKMGSSNTFVNGKPVIRANIDSFVSHGCGDCSYHSGKVSTGSTTVFVEGFPVARNGDSLTCGDKCGPGSSDTIVN